MSSQHKKKLSIWSVLLILLLISGLLTAVAHLMGWIGSGETGHPVEISEVQHRDITRVVTATGRIQPEIEVKIAPDVSGEIVELNIREGDFVQEGQILLRIRPDIIQARLEESEAMLLSQMARLEQNRASKLRAQNEYEQKNILFEREMISQLEYENARRSYEAEQASFNASSYQVENARAQLRRIEEELRQTTVRAPMTGTVSRLLVERGERVVGSIQMTGTEMLRIARMEQMEVRVNVNENDIVYVSESDTARIEVDAYPGRVFLGHVTEIANSAITRGDGTAEQITEYPVKIRILSVHNIDHASAPGSGQAEVVHAGEVRIEEPVARFKPGMTATVDIQTVSEQNALSVPLQAVTMRDMTGKMPGLQTDENNSGGSTTTSGPSRSELSRVVFLVRDHVAEMVEVTTGLSDDRYIHITSGLRAGDKVVSGNYRILSRVLEDGDKVHESEPEPLAQRQ